MPYKSKTAMRMANARMVQLASTNEDSDVEDIEVHTLDQELGNINFIATEGEGEEDIIQSMECDILQSLLFIEVEEEEEEEEENLPFANDVISPRCHVTSSPRCHVTSSSRQQHPEELLLCKGCQLNAEIPDELYGKLRKSLDKIEDTDNYLYNQLLDVKVKGIIKRFIQPKF